MDDTPIITGRPPNTEEAFIKEKYLESISRQPGLMDDVAKQLLTLELAIPGIYVTVLKLISGKDEKLSISGDLYFVFVCWPASLVCIVIALLPRIYKVNVDDHTAIREYFFKTALYKFIWLAASTAIFVAGLFFVLKDLIT